ncbi:MAG: PHP domain-containing protein [Nannocystis sp.]|nr:PHP domain-containing protein [Nannocystis sp.]
MLLELHCHSTCSDGSLSPTAVATEAARHGARVFCLTDHDSLDGHDAAAAALAGTGCAVLRGLELSCREGDRTIHLLIYGVQEGEGERALRARLVEVMASRRERIGAIVGRLAKLGVKLDTEAILRDSAGHTPGRPDVARALLAARVVTSLREAFDRFLKDGGPADVPVGRLGLAEGVALGRACGAKLSIAHPHTLRSFAIVGEFYRRHRAAGLDGIEALYGRYGAREQQTWLRMAEDLDLVVTGGSDFHGASAPEVPRPVIDVPARYAERLCAWLELAA